MNELPLTCSSKENGIYTKISTGSTQAIHSPIYSGRFSFYLAIKNSHLSHYHRHDDNGSFYLEVEGITVFGDGGLGFYKEKDPRRKFLRSPYAHNVMFTEDGIIPRDLRKKTEGPFAKMELFCEDKVVCLFSDSGNVFKRIFDLSKVNQNKLLMIDTWEGEGNSLSNFFIPHEKSVRLQDLGKGFSFVKNEVEVTVKINGGIAEILDYESFDKEIYIPCFSTKYSQFGTGTNIIVKALPSSPNVIFEVVW